MAFVSMTHLINEGRSVCNLQQNSRPRHESLLLQKSSSADQLPWQAVIIATMIARSAEGCCCRGHPAHLVLSHQIEHSKHVALPFIVIVRPVKLQQVNLVHPQPLPADINCSSHCLLVQCGHVSATEHTVLGTDLQTAGAGSGEMRLLQQAATSRGTTQRWSRHVLAGHPHHFERCAIPSR